MDEPTTPESTGPAATDLDAVPYPVGLLLRDRLVVVVGGGQVAQRRVPALLAAGADVLVVSPLLRPAIEGLVSTGEVRHLARGYADGDLEGAWYALAITDDPEVNAAVLDEAERRRVFCVRGDDAVRGSAWTPASGRHDQLTVSVFANRHPRRAAAVRDAVLEGLRSGRVRTDEPRERRGGVVLVGGGPGDPELLTLAGRRALAEADVVVADRLAPRELLSELSPHVVVVDATKLPRGRSAPQQQINDLLVEHARAGRRVVRFKGGDPFVFGRGMEEALACAEAGVPCRVVPGVTSAISVPALAGIPVTHRGVAHGFAVVSGHVPPDDPASLVDWDALARLGGTLVLLMAVQNSAAIAAALIRHGRGPDTPVAVVQEGGLPTERRVVTTLSDLGSAVEREGLRPPAIVVVGEVVDVAAALTTQAAGDTSRG